MPPAVSGVPGGSPRPRAGVPARDGRPNRRRRLPSGDLHRRAARLPASACGQSARLGLHHRAAQGDRPPALALPPCPAGGGRRAIGRSGKQRPRQPMRRRGDEPRHSEIWAAVAELPPGQRAAVVLRFAVDLRYRDVGEALGTSEEGARRQRPRGFEEAAPERGGAEGDDDMTDFVEALATRAAEEGLLDVAYATLDSPVGELVVAATDRGLVRIGLPGSRSTACSRSWPTGSRPGSSLSPPARRGPAGAGPVLRRQAEHFELAVDWRLSHPGFYRRVLRETAKVPFGEVITYGDAAERPATRAPSAPRERRWAQPDPDRRPVPPGRSGRRRYRQLRRRARDEALPARARECALAIACSPLRNFFAAARLGL